MQKALHNKPRLPFRQPPGVSVVRIDPESGQLAAEDATDIIEELFVQGTEPKRPEPPPAPTSVPSIPVTPGLP